MVWSLSPESEPEKEVPNENHGELFLYGSAREYLLYKCQRSGCGLKIRVDTEIPSSYLIVQKPDNPNTTHAYQVVTRGHPETFSILPPDKNIGAFADFIEKFLDFPEE